MPDSVARVRLTEASKLVEAMSKEVFRAIALRALWGRCANDKDVLAAVNDAKLIAFNVTRDALHKDLVLTLTKLYDTGKDDLAFPRVLRVVADPAVCVLLADAQACVEADARFREATDGEHCRSLRLFRNKLLAHNDTRGAEQTAKYGHEVALLEDTIWIATRLSTALPLRSPHYEPAKMVWDHEANRFWTALIAGMDGSPKNNFKSAP
jgi:hypothetical protein